MINAYIHDDNDTSLFHHYAFHGIEHLLDLLLDDTAWSCAQQAVCRTLLFGKWEIK